VIFASLVRSEYRSRCGKTVEPLETRVHHEYSPGQPQNACIFCEAQKNPAHDAESLVVYRGRHNFVILNKYPYTSGHLMIAPNRILDICRRRRKR
jgi:ATP adenylyltransferase